ncbi:MAG: penicillin-binding protein 2 [Myxococcota bacterium]
MSQLLSPRREVGEFRKRYKWMALVVLLVFGGLIAWVGVLQLAQGGDWKAAARENITKTIRLPATRGLIRDVRGRVIAENRPSYVVYVTPQLLPDADRERVEELMGLGEEARARFQERLAAVPRRRRTHQILMFRDISRDQLAALETHSIDLPGIDVVARPVRTYPFGALGAHAVGYLNEVSAEDLERLAEAGREGYGAGDRIGRTGLERSFQEELRGRRGFRRVLVDARGRRPDGALVMGRTEEEVRDPEPGHDLVLSLDMELMRTVDRAFGGHPSGAVVVVDVNDGAIRALYSKPSYDSNALSGGISHGDYAELRDNPFRPLIDKAIFDTWFPGSTFKPISALAALGDGVLDPSQRVECKGVYEIGRQRMRCTSSHGDVDMAQSLVQSCNVYFYRLAEQVGLERLNRYARLFGLGERTGVGINSEARGFLATREWYEERFGRYRVGYTLNTAIGQGNTRTTLLQLALAYGALANGGTLYEPYLVESVREPDGTLVRETQPRVRRRLDLSEEHLAYVNESLNGVVNAQTGTAYEARLEGGVNISGKTGTAEVAPGTPRANVDPDRAWYFNRSHAWFAGFAPAERPEVAIVVLVEHGGAGGRAAAPIGLQILQDHLGGRTTTARNEVGRRGEGPRHHGHAHAGPRANGTVR